jgi:hypothetical protein
MLSTSCTKPDRRAVVIIAAVIIFNAFLYLLSRAETYVHIDAIAHVNKARGLFDNYTPGLKQLGSIWLPLPHIIVAPLAWFDALWISGAAGSIVSALCFIGTGWFLFSTAYTWTRSKSAGWLAFLLFALNPRLIYLFTTPMTEPLMILCAAGVTCYLVRWVQTDSWNDFAAAACFAFAGTLTRYEGWPIAAAAIPLVALIAKRQRIASAILFAGAVSIGPMLWMLYNMFYFDDPLMFTYGRGSARDYAMEYFFRTGKTYATAGNWMDSFGTYFIDVAYCLSPIVLWLGIGGLFLVWKRLRYGQWRTTFVVLMAAGIPFSFYVFNLYTNQVPILLPGLLKNEPDSIFNVRYGAIMVASVPILAAFALHVLFQQIERRRRYAFVMMGLMLLPDPIPFRSLERSDRQLTENLFYTEGIRNQSYWMPPFVEIGKRLGDEISASNDQEDFILANGRIVHPVVWATGIPIRRFIHEMNKDRWDQNVGRIDPGIRWVITEEGDQLWNAHGATLKQEFDDVAQARTPTTGIVHLFRRRTR